MGANRGEDEGKRDLSRNIMTENQCTWICVNRNTMSHWRNGGQISNL